MDSQHMAVFEAHPDRSTCTHCGRVYWTIELSRAELADIDSGRPCPSDDCKAHFRRDIWNRMNREG